MQPLAPFAHPCRITVVICLWLILNEPISMVSIMFVSAFDLGTQVCAADLKRCVAPPKVYLPLSHPDVPLALNICLSRVITGDYSGVISTPGGHTQVTQGPESSLLDRKKIFSPPMGEGLFFSSLSTRCPAKTLRPSPAYHARTHAWTVTRLSCDSQRECTQHAA